MHNLLKLSASSMLLTLLLAGCAHQAQPRTPIATNSCAVTPAQLASVRAINAQAVSRGFAPGITSHIYCDGKPLLSDTYGYADVTRKRVMVDDDLFRIYSMTKPLTSLATMILVDDKRLNLDDPVAKFLPQFAATSVFESGDTPESLITSKPVRPVTVRDLLRHTAGIGYISPAPGAINRLYVLRGIDNGGGTLVVPADKTAPIANIDEFVRRLASIPLLHQPGERFTYGNSTDVLAAVIAKASGQRYREFMATRIFSPLKMNDTFFEVPSDKISRLTAAYAAKSTPGDQGGVLRRARIADLGQGSFNQVEDPAASIFARSRPIDFGGAGLVSTAPDYQRFLQMMLNDGNLEGVRIVSPGTVAETTRNQLDAKALASASLAAQGLGFGLGFARFMDSNKAPVAVPEGGYFWAGAASTYFWVDPTRRLSGVVMTQVFGGDVMPFYLEMLHALYPTDKPIKK